MIGVVILNYNTYQDTAKLVEALQRQTIAPKLQIVVVDNASPNGSYEHLKPLEKQFTGVYVLQTGENLGYARGNNFGLKYLEENIRPEYVAILNNDVILPDDCFEKLAAKYPDLEDACIISPVQLNPQGKEIVMGRTATFGDDLLNLSFLCRRLRKYKAKLTDNTGRRAMRVDMIPGSFMFAALDRFKSIGYFYPGTFLYVEERFVAHRAKQAGFQNYLLLDEQYLHLHGKTIDTAAGLLTRYRYQYDGWVRFTRECRKYPSFKLWVLKPLIRLSLLEIRIAGTLRKR